MEIFTESQFSACYMQYREKVNGYIFSRVRDREEAEDLTQDVFEHIWRCREGVRMVTLQNLVFRVMRNTVIDYLRRRYMKKAGWTYTATVRYSVVAIRSKKTIVIKNSALCMRRW